MRDGAIEEPVFFGNGDRLFGIVTLPARRRPETTGVVVMPGAHFQSANRNRLSVDLCRRLAASGVASVRFDYTGIGESLGVLQAYRLDRPLEEDALEAVGLLRRLGVGRILLAGTCFGARTALAAAAPAGATRVALVSCPVRDFEQGRRSATHRAVELSMSDVLRKAFRPEMLKGLRDPARRADYLQILRTRASAIRPTRSRRRGVPGWVSRSFSKALGSLEDKGTKILFVYGDGDENFKELQLAGDLPARIRASENIEVAMIPGEIAGFSNIGTQQAVLEILDRWCLELPREKRPKGVA